MQGRAGGMLFYFTLAMTAIYAVLGIYIMVSDSLEGFFTRKEKSIYLSYVNCVCCVSCFRVVKLNKQMHNQG